MKEKGYALVRKVHATDTFRVPELVRVREHYTQAHTKERKKETLAERNKNKRKNATTYLTIFLVVSVVVIPLLSPSVYALSMAGDISLTATSHSTK